MLPMFFSQDELFFGRVGGKLEVIDIVSGSGEKRGRKDFW
jgi:hypothetical protein